MGAMKFFNNGKKRWSLIVDGEPRRKGPACRSMSSWVTVEPGPTLEHSVTQSYTRAGNLGTVAAEFKCTAQATQYEVVDEEDKVSFRNAFPDAPLKFWCINDCKVYATSARVNGTGYSLNAEIDRVLCINAGRGKANWGGLKILYKVHWGGFTGVETATLTFTVTSSKEKLSITKGGS